MKCLKAVMDALKIYQLQTSTKQECTDLSKVIDDLRSRMRKIYWDAKRKKLDLDNIQLMKTLVKHVLQNFISNSYMERHAFVYQLDDFDPTLDDAHGNTNFIALIKESFTFNQDQKPTC